MWAHVLWIAGKVLPLREIEVFAIVIIAVFFAIRKTPLIFIYIENIDLQSNSIIF